MVFDIVGLGLATLGEVLVALSVLSVHRTVSKERKIDREVIKKMKFERGLVVVGIILIIVGFISRVLGFNL